MLAVFNQHFRKISELSYFCKPQKKIQILRKSVLPAV